MSDFLAVLALGALVIGCWGLAGALLPGAAARARRLQTGLLPLALAIAAAAIPVPGLGLGGPDAVMCNPRVPRQAG